ncbi:hypothetical protein PG996_012012 [Apiospora saccharicola]|uniref:Uncharacterized protein n=1 Tax=Apiospora saccharicola TaxID=335842 RepID=A0ABR1U1D3_9PEZI
MANTTKTAATSGSSSGKGIWSTIKRAAKEHHQSVNAAYSTFYGMGTTGITNSQSSSRTNSARTSPSTSQAASPTPRPAPRRSTRSAPGLTTRASTPPSGASTAPARPAKAGSSR